MLCTVRAKGKLVGWGDDFFLMDNNGKITTYNCEGDSLGSVKYNPNKEYIGSIRKKGFTLVSSKNEKRKKPYQRLTSMSPSRPNKRLGLKILIV